MFHSKTAMFRLSRFIDKQKNTPLIVGVVATKKSPKGFFDLSKTTVFSNLFM